MHFPLCCSHPRGGDRSIDLELSTLVDVVRRSVSMIPSTHARTVNMHVAGTIQGCLHAPCYTSPAMHLGADKAGESTPEGRAPFHACVHANGEARGRCSSAYSDYVCLEG